MDKKYVGKPKNDCPCKHKDDDVLNIIGNILNYQALLDDSIIITEDIFDIVENDEGEDENDDE